MMKDWVDSIYEEDKKQGTHYLYDFGFQFGDWLALDGATDQSTFGRTDAVFIASAYYYASVCYVAEAAKILRKTADENQYAVLADKIYQAVLAEFFTPNGRLSVDTQTGYFVALKFKLYRDKQKVIAGLQKRLQEDCQRIKGGFVGATMMNSVLAENGMADWAYDFLFFEGYPGWLYPVNLGATTIWERWNSVLPDGKARTILFHEQPEIKSAYEKKDIETLSKSLKDLKKQRLSLDMPADIYDKVVQKLAVLRIYPSGGRAALPGDLAGICRFCPDRFAIAPGVVMAGI